MQMKLISNGEVIDNDPNLHTILNNTVEKSTLMIELLWVLILFFMTDSLKRAAVMYTINNNLTNGYKVKWQ